MVSTLKLTKIQIPNSDSDVLSFNSSTGIMNFHKDIQGEGTGTTNLQQGLSKHWINLNGQSTPAFRDSFNAGSITDNGTGDYSIAITNNMANGNYNIISGVNSYSGDNDYRFPTFIKATGTNDWSTMATGSYRLQCNQVANGASTTDPSLVNKTIFGDLA